jgi:chemotaxis signal transduction protein
VLSLGPRPRPRTIRTLVVEASATRIALAVDRVVGVESLPEAPEVPREDAAGLERGRLLRGDDPVPVLDVAKLVQLLRSWAS